MARSRCPSNITLQAAGKTAGQLQEDIRKEYVPKYYNYLKYGQSRGTRFYYVGGEVKVGVASSNLRRHDRAARIDTAGGFTDFCQSQEHRVDAGHPAKKSPLTGSKRSKDPSLDSPFTPTTRFSCTNELVVVQLTFYRITRRGPIGSPRRFPVQVGRAPVPTLCVQEDGVWENHLQISHAIREGFLLAPSPRPSSPVQWPADQRGPCFATAT